MAITPFTTWTELLAHLLERYRNHSFGRAEATVAGETIKWNSAKDLREAIEHARTMAAMETGTASFRTFAKNGGRG
jgi:hypothetical protein